MVLGWRPLALTLPPIMNGSTPQVAHPRPGGSSPVVATSGFRWAVRLLGALCLAAGSGSYAQNAPAASTALASAPNVDPRVEEILSRQQKRSDGLKDIRCAVRYDEDDRMNLVQRSKSGHILFMVTADNPNFFVHFDRIAMDGVAGKQEWYLFDGRWLYQAIERLQQVTKQEIAREGERVDLFDLERAPFPLPFGQAKETIQRHFEVKLVPPAAGDPAHTDHLVCVPKPESRMYRKYDKLEFFVHREVHLPVRVIATKGGGLEVITADFPDLSDKSINAGVTRKDFSRPAAWKGYKEVVESLDP